jgi:hypothetical protein
MEVETRHGGPVWGRRELFFLFPLPLTDTFHQTLLASGTSFLLSALNSRYFLYTVLAFHDEFNFLINLQCFCQKMCTSYNSVRCVICFGENSTKLKKAVCFAHGATSITK